MAFPTSCKDLPSALAKVCDFFKFVFLDCGIRLKVCVDNTVRIALVSTVKLISNHCTCPLT